MRIIINSLLTSFILATALECVTAQTLPPEITGRIDSLFSQWARTSSPGCAVGVVRNDSLIFSKGFGMATENTIYSSSPETMATSCSPIRLYILDFPALEQSASSLINTGP